MVIEPSSCLVVFVSRKAMEPSYSISMVNLMLALIELRCEWSSSTCSLFTHTWLSSTYLNHHLGGFGADKRAFSSTYSLTRLAKIALTGDTKTTRQDDGSITVSVYRKATHIDRYLDFKSHHHPQHKHSVVRSLMDRAKDIPSTEDEALRESKRVTETLTANNFPCQFHL